MSEHDARGAQALGLAAPEAATLKDEPPGRPGHEGFRDQGNADRQDCPATVAGEQAGVESHDANRNPTLIGAPCRAQKLRANVFAHAALAGVAVVELADGSFLATWRGLLKPCADLDAVEDLVRRLTPGGAA